VRTDATPTVSAKPAPRLSDKEVEIFSNHCVFIRSVHLLAMRIWRDSNAAERERMLAVAPLFFIDVGQVLSEYLVTAACRITDAASDPRGNENFTVELFVNSFSSDKETYQQLDELHQRMKKLRQKILPARNKIGAHADRDVIKKDLTLGAATWDEWDEFWSALKEFVRTLNVETTGQPFEIDAAGVKGDAEMFLKAFSAARS
jgi:HEPN superfamily AbiU2-like protein